MNIRLLYSLLDSKSGKYGDTFHAADDADATRGVILGLRSGKPLFAQFPEDYSLYAVGHFDRDSGLLVSYPNPKHVVAVNSLHAVAASEARNEKA